MPRPSVSPMPVLAALVLAACQDDTTAPADPAAAVAAAAAVWTQVTVGGQHTCAIASGARAYCWGYAESGRLGTGTTALYQATPTRVSGGLQFAQISAGTEHTCAVTTAQKAYCWGSSLFRSWATGPMPRDHPGSRRGRTQLQPDSRRRLAHLRAHPDGQGVLLGRQPVRRAGRRHHDDAHHAGRRARRPDLPPPDGGGAAYLRRDHDRQGVLLGTRGRRAARHGPAEEQPEAGPRLRRTRLEGGAAGKQSHLRDHHRGQGLLLGFLPDRHLHRPRDRKQRAAAPWRPTPWPAPAPGASSPREASTPAA